MAKFSLIICVLFCILNTFNTLSISCNHYHLEALLEFQSLVLYNHSETSQRSKNKGQFWNSSIRCCKWPGITCDARGDVTELHLYYALMDDTYKVQMIINSEALNPIFRITSLTSLNLDSCGIQGKMSGIGFANLTRLVKLSIYNNKFEGLLPLEIFTNLRQLQDLFMLCNHLQGKIPEQVGNLTELQSLSLGVNNLEGENPRSIFKLERLEDLDLQSNELYGEFPSDIGNLTNLKNIFLNEMKLEGKLPSSMQRMENLVYLQLENNDLYGEIPTWLFNFPNMTSLQLGGNKLSWNNRDEAFHSNSSLIELSLASCNLSGPFPTWLSNQTSLLHLDLSGNHLEGGIPPWLPQLGVGRLFLSDNHLTGSLEDVDLLFREGLYHLDLSRNNFHGHLPENIGEARNITILLLSGNKFSGSLPKTFSKLENLEMLDLSDNNLAGDSDKFPVFSSSLQRIDISLNRFSGEVPIYSFPPTTKVLSLSQNNFQGRLPGNLGTKFVQLVQLDLYDNKLTGKIPASISNMSLLQVLNLRNNKLKGRIPEELSTLPNLRIMDLSNNLLEGEVPLSLGNLTAMISAPDEKPLYRMYLGLKFMDNIVNWKKSKQTLSGQFSDLYYILDISNNQLLGQLPPSLGNLKCLKLLNFSHNSISGQIPSSLGDLENVEIIDLSHNKFSGEMPKTFSRLPYLNWLDVSNNQLDGPIPESQQMDRINDPIYYANNSGLCGVQILKPCRNGVATFPNLPEAENGEETMFSWKLAGIGFPVGFFSTIGVACVLGYFE